MSGRLDGKTAVITGGANGLGRACAVRFASEGASIVVADVQDEAAAETVRLVEQAGTKAVAVHVDARSADDNDAAVEAAVGHFGGVDIAVTAAGVTGADYRSGDLDHQRERMTEAIERGLRPGGAIVHGTMDDWQQTIDINLTGTMLAVRAVARRMVEQERGGSIITIASIAAKRPDAGPLSYTVSKAGVWMLTKSAARDLAPLGIRVNAIGPGFIQTNMTWFVEEMDYVKDMLMPQIPMGRMGQPEEIASVAAFLASDDSSYMTGEILHPDGGYFTE